MASVQQLPLESLDGLDLLPLAGFREPVAFFTDGHGISFAQENDDLDVYAIAALGVTRSTGPSIFALRRYRHAPEDTVDVLVPVSATDAASLIAEIARQLGVADGRVIWPEHRRKAS